jgi:predicted RNA-binding Zn-ribbon protein involved in translation (DUF1610 family)
MSFLHDEKIVPPDETVDTETPACDVCGQEMWLVSFSKTISDAGAEGSYRYECPNCGAVTKLRKSVPDENEAAALARNV